MLLNNADDDHAAVLGDDRVITNDATTIETEEKFATIVLDFSHVDFLDFTSANAIKVSCIVYKIWRQFFNRIGSSFERLCGKDKLLQAV